MTVARELRGVTRAPWRRPSGLRSPRCRTLASAAAPAPSQAADGAWRRSLLSGKTLPTLKTDAAASITASEALLVRGGLVQKSSAGIYNFLPMGYRVLEKLERLVARHMDGVPGAERVRMAQLLPAHTWRTTGRLAADADAGQPSEKMMLRDRKNALFLLAPTHEEEVTSMLAGHTLSPRTLPKRLYQISLKFRDELRTRGGLLRSREFLMKDLYSFDVDAAAAQASYAAVMAGYEALWTALGIAPKRVAADNGEMGGTTSDEYHLLSPVGEDTLVVCPSCDHAAIATDGAAIAIDIAAPADGTAAAAAATTTTPATAASALCAQCGTPFDRAAHTHRAIEVGHLFDLGTRYSVPLGATYTDAAGRAVPAHMGSYGIGVTRLMAALLELGHAAAAAAAAAAPASATTAAPNRAYWPEAVAPYRVALAAVPAGGSGADDAVAAATRRVFEAITAAVPALAGDVLVDDRRGRRFGEKMSDLELIGVPYIVILGKRFLASGQAEVRVQKLGPGHTIVSETHHVAEADLPAYFARVLAAAP
ncbi:hypothetical protein CXG81DRAFT_19593 [Caulochytrium protostelioides]|uniref:proline--tRNA ligase n=1 Tax=Caulochytrium protostelioides TaxID=1555241 RepID=A0A4P9X5N0_9FUNG|nr:hypothetical protein CXG81DRAFT_19593 [Caulochytrium protostelioides]|eukprot:RKP00444.1 hypothetical protein CXG81DRAFT_19593 [Caulochytrium protostelioides]